MKKIIVATTLFYFTILHSFSQKTDIPYCYQGHTTDTSTYIWCITGIADSNQNFYLQSNDEPLKATNGTWNTFNKHRYGHIRLSNLSPNTDYSLVFKDEQIFNFKTYPTHRDSVTLLVGSCAMKTFGKHWIFRPNFRYPIYDVMSSTKNDAMIWMGDNLYLLGRESYSDKKQSKKYIRTRKVPQLIHFLQSTPQYSMWDDHDFGPNNSDGTFKHKDISLKNFQQFWANPAPVDSNEGIYYSIRYPQVEIFLTDNRYHAKNGERYFSDEQMKWLQNGLKNSTAPFKIIISGNQANNTQTRHETLYMTGEFQKIIESIKVNQVSGVLFVNGDRHHSEMFKHQLESIYPIYEFTNSALTSVATGIRKRNQEYNNPARIHGVTKAHVFGKISIFPDHLNSENLLIRLETINKRGKILWEETISLIDISYP